MNKKELVTAIAYKSGVTQKDVSKVLDSLLGTIQDQVSKGEKVAIVGFGKFEKRDRAERQGRNPRTGEPMTLPAASVPVFVPGENFKELVNF